MQRVRPPLEALFISEESVNQDERELRDPSDDSSKQPAPQEVQL